MNKNDVLILIIEYPSGVYGGVFSNRINKVFMSFDELEKLIPEISALREKYTQMTFDSTDGSYKNSLAYKIYDKVFYNLSEFVIESWNTQKDVTMPSTIIEIHIAVLL